MEELLVPVFGEADNEDKQRQIASCPGALKVLVIFATTGIGTRWRLTSRIAIEDNPIAGKVALRQVFCI
jgi:hypothetical protein